MARNIRTLHLTAALLTTVISVPAHAVDACASLLDFAVKTPVSGPVTPERLATLRDIGAATQVDRRRPLFSLSPDKRSIAFQLHQADPETNSYCVGIVVLSLDRPRRARLIDLGQELIADEHARYGWAAFHVGSAATITPHWSPDGKWLAYLKRVNGSTQVWLAAADGAGARQISRSAVDVEDLRISSGGGHILFKSRPDLIARVAEINREALTGWRYDERAFPVRGARPQTPDAKTQFTSISIKDETTHPATDAEIALFSPSKPIPASAGAFTITPSGRIAWTQPEGEDGFLPHYRLMATSPSGAQTCADPACVLDGSSSIWWAEGGERLRFSRAEGWVKSLTGIYEWTPGKGRPRRLYQTSDDLVECEAWSNDLLCLRERSLEPKHLVRLSLPSGKEERIFDPNPDFAALRLGRVERLHWRNADNIPFYADLVYPVDYDPKQRYPLVVVQYRSKGFLRGGIGDEAPIQPLAGRGYFVFSMDSMNYEDIAGKHATARDMQAAFNRNFLGRRRILSAIEIAVRRLIAQGQVDERRVGITGLSDGATTVQFAGVNSSLFSAASSSGFGWEPIQDAMLGPVIGKLYQKDGWPGLADKNPQLWSQISFIEQPRRVAFPVLYQPPDNEFLNTVGGYTALREAGVPADMFIFPDEDHIKRQPAHRLAVYRRNIAWFDFWLKDEMPTAPADRQEAERWAVMRRDWLRIKGKAAP